ncbi:hypothetical protein [Mycobacterium talmoniae]|uniref:Uncharacterized protein n=1 Tax=Mycobacterium talmoniae TaxID=1858794 RepID=A0A2S8BLG2_9MYCO|nr:MULTISPECIES: hypothetical protein [Mycobacterium]PQM47541.1 hypothetical protein C1Y40_02241 [Mycobacterium talmoniae]TDH54488.1 hypothetical protein E2F47_11545 [Mycobacterium eburneum]
MRFRDRLTGTRRPDPGVPAAPPEHLRAVLLALNRPGQRWTIRDGAPEGVDLVAEWQIVDANWQENLAKSTCSAPSRF